MLRINNKATSWATIGSIDRKFGISFGLEKRPRSCGQFGTKLLLLMSGGPAFRRLQFPINVFLASLTPNITQPKGVECGAEFNAAPKWLRGGSDASSGGSIFLALAVLAP